MSERFDCSDPAQREQGLTAAAAALRAGLLVVTPTDTVYGVAADPAQPGAVQALLAAKHRTAAAPPPVLIAGPGQLEELAATVSPRLRRLAAAFWPGGLTLVVPSASGLDWQLGETHGTIALRVPDNGVARDLLRRTGPLAVSSANLHEQPSALDIDAAQRMLAGTVAVYLDGGPTPGALSSTIVVDDPAVPGGLRFLRHGAISDDRIRQAADGPEATCAGT